MIHVIATIHTRPGRRSDFLAAFHALVPKVRAEAGCIEYGPAVDLATTVSNQSPVRDNTMTVLEKWATVEALQAHLAAMHMEEYRKQVKDLITGVELQVLEPA